MVDPLDYIDFADVIKHGDPRRWTFLGKKAGSGVPATSIHAPAGTTKEYDIHRDEFGTEIEVHYFRHLDGDVSGVKVVPRT